MLNSKEHTMWVEKYRPQSLEEYIGNDHIVQKVKIFLENKDIPHLLFYGIQGTGKTTISKIIVSHIDCDHIYVNASDETSVENVRTKIKRFASTAGFNDLKVVILDEADYLSPNAQAALRNLMETFSKTTRFILTCNYLEKIIKPIYSRCQSFEVVPPDKKTIAKHVAGILTKENVGFQDDMEGLRIIVESNYPDIRKIIHSAQHHTTKQGLFKVDVQNVIEQNYMLKILELLKKSTSNPQKLFLDIRKIIADSKVRQFEPLYRFLYDNLDEITSDATKRAAMILIISESQSHDTLVVDKEINVMAMFVKIINEL